VPPTADPRFTKMNILFRTTDQNKDPNSELEIFILRPHDEAAVAYLDIGGNSQPHVPNMEFQANLPTPTFEVPTFGDGFTLKDLRTDVVFLKMTPVGTDRWTFGFDAVLHFDDQTTATLIVYPGYLVLDNSIQDFARMTRVSLNGAGVIRPV
jgi:hypothetical protein